MNPNPPVLPGATPVAPPRVTTPLTRPVSKRPPVRPEDGHVSIGYVGFIKWAVMIAAIAWMLMYRLDENAAHVAGFVYANF